MLVRNFLEGVEKDKLLTVEVHPFKGVIETLTVEEIVMYYGHCDVENALGVRGDVFLKIYDRI